LFFSSKQINIYNIFDRSSPETRRTEERKEPTVKIRKTGEKNESDFTQDIMLCGLYLIVCYIQTKNRVSQILGEGSACWSWWFVETAGHEDLFRERLRQQMGRLGEYPNAPRRICNNNDSSNKHNQKTPALHPQTGSNPGGLNKGRGGPKPPTLHQMGNH
jgi:hypothetical protein